MTRSGAGTPCKRPEGDATDRHLTQIYAGSRTGKRAVFIAEIGFGIPDKRGVRCVQERVSTSKITEIRPEGLARLFEENAHRQQGGNHPKFLPAPLTIWKTVALKVAATNSNRGMS